MPNLVQAHPPASPENGGFQAVYQPARPAASGRLPPLEPYGMTTPHFQRGRHSAGDAMFGSTGRTGGFATCGEGAIVQQVVG